MSIRMPGDWTCNSCQHLNFSFRDYCQICGEKKFNGDSSDFTSLRGGQGGPLFGSGISNFLPGDWYCSCGTHNFASRANCFRCAAPKADGSATARGSFDADMPRSRGSSSIGTGAAGWRPGDWTCPRSGCNAINFANRNACFRCKAPKNSF